MPLPELRVLYFVLPPGGRLKDDGKIWLPSSEEEANAERTGTAQQFSHRSLPLPLPVFHVHRY